MKVLSLYIFWLNPFESEYENGCIFPFLTTFVFEEHIFVIRYFALKHQLRISVV